MLYSDLLQQPNQTSLMLSKRAGERMPRLFYTFCKLNMSYEAEWAFEEIIKERERYEPSIKWRIPKKTSPDDGAELSGGNTAKFQEITIHAKDIAGQAGVRALGFGLEHIAEKCFKKMAEPWTSSRNDSLASAAISMLYSDRGPDGVKAFYKLTGLTHSNKHTTKILGHLVGVDVEAAKAYLREYPLSLNDLCEKIDELSELMYEDTLDVSHRKGNSKLLQLLVFADENLEKLADTECPYNVIVAMRMACFNATPANLEWLDEVISSVKDHVLSGFVSYLTREVRSEKMRDHLKNHPRIRDLWDGEDWVMSSLWADSSYFERCHGENWKEEILWAE